VMAAGQTRPTGQTGPAVPAMRLQVQCGPTPMSLTAATRLTKSRGLGWHLPACTSSPACSSSVPLPPITWLGHLHSRWAAGTARWGNAPQPEGCGWHCQPWQRSLGQRVARTGPTCANACREDAPDWVMMARGCTACWGQALRHHCCTKYTTIGHVQVASSRLQLALQHGAAAADRPFRRQRQQQCSTAQAFRQVAEVPHQESSQAGRAKRSASYGHRMRCTDPALPLFGTV
jgi:hypothetical protein